MSYNLNHLRTLVMIGKTGSITATARALGRTQSAVSLHIKELESRLRLELLDRSVRPVQFTLIGQAVLREAEKVLNAAARINSLSSTTSVFGRLVVGAIPTTIPWLVAPALAQFKRRFPTVSVHLKSSNSRELTEMWQHGALDMAILVKPPEAIKGTDFSVLRREPYVLISPMSNELSDPKSILDSFPFIWFDRTTLSSALVREIVEASGSTQPAEIECDTLEGIIAMVANGLGISIVPVLTGHTPYTSSVNVHDLSVGGRSRHIGMLTHSPANRREIVERLCEVIASVSHATIG
ncbi:MAG: LysR substrate-binding domain-containing protein [Rhizobiaceae bacterium]